MRNGSRLCNPAGSELWQIDLTDPALFATQDLTPLWRRLRKVAPVAWQQLADGRGFWVVTGHADCGAVLADHETFTSRDGTMLVSLGTGDPAGGREMSVSDPPHHTALRQPLQQVVNSIALRRWIPRIRTFVRQTISQACAGEVWDVASTMAVLTMKVTELIMGLSLDTETSVQLKLWATAAMAPNDPECAIMGGERETLRSARLGVFRFFAEEIAHRRRRTAESGNDLIDRLLALRLDGKRLSAGDLAVNCYSLLLGANNTTGHVTTATIAHFLDKPELYVRWSADPQLLRSGVEEAIRWSSPVLHVLRHARHDTELRGVPITAGDAVTVWLVSANRDELMFADPDTFDPNRRPNPHMAFSAGVHYCIGAVTARVVLRIVFEEIFGLVDHFESAGPTVRLHSTFVNGIKHLPVVAYPVPRAQLRG